MDGLRGDLKKLWTKYCSVVAWLTPASDPVHKITIIPHGLALGVTEQFPGENLHNYSRTYLMARLAVMLGGRTVRRLFLEM
jgi:cell division protease FtsH